MNIKIAYKKKDKHGRMHISMNDRLLNKRGRHKSEFITAQLNI